MPGPNVEIKRELQKMNSNLEELNDNLNQIMNDDNPDDEEQLKEPMAEKFVCDECGRDFNSRNGLNAHMRSHKD